MAKIRVEVPDGDSCEDCQFEGLDWCYLFEVWHDDNKKIPQCVEATVKEESNG